MIITMTKRAVSTPFWGTGVPSFCHLASDLTVPRIFDAFWGTFNIKGFWRHLGGVNWVKRSVSVLPQSVHALAGCDVAR